MKLWKLLTTLGATAVVSAFVFSSAQGAVKDTKHNMNNVFGTNTIQDNQVCLPCHAPHNQPDPTLNTLWNHVMPDQTKYKLWDGAEGLDETSRKCLSCHDGTVAVDSFGGGAGTQQLTGGLLGTDLTNDHPIGEGAIWPNPNPSYMVDPALRTAAGIMPLRNLADGRAAVGCTSCHEPHNRKNQANMLWVNNSGAATTVDGRAVSGSALCLNCHKK